MKVNMVVGGRFNAPPMAAALSEMVDLQVYTSVPPDYWPGAQKAVRLVPHISILYAKVLKQSPGRRFKDFSTGLFSKMAALRMRSDADIVYAWASFGLEAMKYGHRSGAKTILDRACPHIEFQENLLSEEAKILGMHFERSGKEFSQRCEEEYDLADLIVVPSQYTKRTFLEKGFPASKLKLISLGPNFQPKSSEPCPDLGRRNSFVLGVAIGSVLRKGLLYLLQAWKMLNLKNGTLKLKCPEIELKKSPEIEKILASMPNIEIIGYTKNMEEFYRSCDLFCLPSVDDGFGMVVIEAIACGCPVLVTDGVGAADIVLEGKTGFVVETRNSQALAERIHEVYEHPEKLIEMSRSCSAFYKDYISVDSYFNQVEELVTTMKVK